MPQFTQLGNQAIVTLEALDPTTGAVVTGVVVTNVDIYADVAAIDTSGPGAATGPYMLVPGPNA